MKLASASTLALSGLLYLSACDESTAPAAQAPANPAASDTLPAPRIDPAGGLFSRATTAHILAPSPDVQVRCTMDGSAPTTASPLCQDSVAITTTLTLKARAFKDGSAPSRIDSARFVIDVRQSYDLPATWDMAAELPMTLVLGKDSSLELLAIPASVSFASPAERTRGTWHVQDSLLTFTSTAFDTSADGVHWYASSRSSSPTTSFVFRISGDSLFLSVSGKAVAFQKRPMAQLPTPRVLPSSDTFATSQTIVLQSSQPGTTIRYTLDGTIPTESSPAYASPFALAKNTTLKAVAFATGFRPSEVAVRNFVFKPSIQGSWKTTHGVMARFDFNEDGSLIYTVIDSATPRGYLFKGRWDYQADQVCMDMKTYDTTIDAGKTWMPGGSTHENGCDAFYIVADMLSIPSQFDTTRLVRIGTASAAKERVAAPQADLPDGVVWGGSRVAFSSATPGAVIRYAINGTVTDTSPIYAGTPIRIDASTWFEVMATKNGLQNSSILQLSYTVDERGHNPDTNFVDPRDGHAYGAVKIGRQTWMTENLAYASDSSWCYDDDTSNCNKYGRLYNQSAALAGAPQSTSAPSLVQGVCPAGWHLPSRSEWDTLIAREGGKDSAGIKLLGLKAGGSDQTGMSILLGGTRPYDAITHKPFYEWEGMSAYFWTASQEYLFFNYQSRYVSIYINNPEAAHSVRCVLN